MEESELESFDKAYEVLPHDLIAQHILTRLPIKSLLLFKSVSKQWYTTLSSSHFALTHFKFSPSPPPPPTHYLFIQNRNSFYLHPLNYDEISNIADTTHKNLVKLECNFDDHGLVLIGSCNGLVCLASFNGNYFILCNPITGKFQKYMDYDFVFIYSSNFRVSWGFGYVFLTDDYKVVRIVEWPGTLEIWVHVFSLKLNRWTRIADEVYDNVLSLRPRKVKMSDFDIDFVEGLLPFSYLFHSRQGVLLDETLYWIVSSMNGWGRKIVAFDLVSVTFYVVEDLILVSNAMYRDKFLCVVGGCLSKCGVSLHDDADISMFKGSRNVEVIRLSKDLGLRSCQNIVGFTGTSKLFVLLEDSTIGYVDLKSQPVNYTPLVTFESLGRSRVANCISSLFSPGAVEI